MGQAREFCLEIPAPGSGLASLTGSVHRGSGAVPVECHLHQGLSFWKRRDQTGNWWMQMFLLSPSFSTCPPEKSYLVICKNNKFPLPTARCCFLWGEKCVSNWLFLFFFSFFLFFLGKKKTVLICQGRIRFPRMTCINEEGCNGYWLICQNMKWKINSSVSPWQMLHPV